jgi:transposase
MDYHQNARLTIHSREQLAKIVMERGCTLKAAAAAFNVSSKTAAKWAHRYREQGVAGLKDRSSRPHGSPRKTSSFLLERVLALRQLRWNGWRIAGELRLSRATVSRILRRAKLNRLRSLDPPPPVVRYEHQHPGDLIHFDIKRLARIVKPGHRIHGDRARETRGAGYEYLHVAIDDHSRIGFAAILPDQTHQSAIRFFLMARAYYARFGFSIRRLLTDNGSCYRHWLFRKILWNQNVKHRFTRTYIYSTHQRKSRTLYPDRSARMGLRKTLARLYRKRRIPPALDRLLQPPTTPW